MVGMCIVRDTHYCSKIQEICHAPHIFIKNAVGEPTGRAPRRGAARPIDCVKLTEFQYCNSSEKNELGDLSAESGTTVFLFGQLLPPQRPAPSCWQLPSAEPRSTAVTARQTHRLSHNFETVIK